MYNTDYGSSNYDTTNSGYDGESVSNGNNGDAGGVNLSWMQEYTTQRNPPRTTTTRRTTHRTTTQSTTPPWNLVYEDPNMSYTQPQYTQNTMRTTRPTRATRPTVASRPADANYWPSATESQSTPQHNCRPSISTVNKKQINCKDTLLFDEQFTNNWQNRWSQDIRMPLEFEVNCTWPFLIDPSIYF